MSARELILATHNEGKAREIRAALAGVHAVTLGAHPEIEMPEETGETFEANAALKAEHVSRLLGRGALADDSGLAVDALGGAPGVRSARYAEGSDRDRYLKLLAELSGVSEEARRARFVCALAFAAPGRDTVIVRGACEGRILEAPRGEGGFGYDPVFLPEGKDRSMAELALEEKNEISHRGRALAAILPELRSFFSLV